MKILKYFCIFCFLYSCLLEVKAYDVDYEFYNYTVLVKITNSGTKYCNGFNHKAGHIILSASCIGDATADSVLVLAGSWNKSFAAEFGVEAVLVHSQYNSATKENDIAKVIMTPTLAPIPRFGFTSPRNYTDNMHCDYVGFSSAKELLQKESTMMKACDPESSNHVCFVKEICDFYPSAVLSCYSGSTDDHFAVAIENKVDCKGPQGMVTMMKLDQYTDFMNAEYNHNNGINIPAFTMSLLFAVNGLLIYYGYCFVIKIRKTII